MAIANPQLSPITVGMKGGAKGLRMLVGTNVGNLCQRTSLPRLLISPVSATSRSRFCTYAMIEGNKSSLRNRDSDVGCRGAVCTISSNYPTKGRWGCKVKAATHSLAMSSILTCFLFLSLIFWEMTQAKKLKRLVLALRSFFPSAPMDYNTDRIRPASHRAACAAEGYVILSADEAHNVAGIVAMFLFLQKAAILREKKRSNIKRILPLLGLMCVSLWVGLMCIKGEKWAVDLVGASEKGEKVWKIISAVTAIFK